MGLLQNDISEPPAMILHRAKHASADQYLKAHPGPKHFIKIASGRTFQHAQGISNIMLKIYGMANGLAYLHSRTPPVVHGDLHMVCAGILSLRCNNSKYSGDVGQFTCRRKWGITPMRLWSQPPAPRDQSSSHNNQDWRKTTIPGSRTHFRERKSTR